MPSLMQFLRFSVSSAIQRSISSPLSGLFALFYKFFARLIGRPLPADGEPSDLSNNAAVQEADAPSVEICPQSISYITIPGSWERCAKPNLSPGRFSIPKPRPGQVVYVTKGKLLAWGGTAILERLPSGDVIKTPKPHPYLREDHCQNMRLEAQIYQRVGQHPHVPKFIEWDPETCCLTMEYLDNGNLGEYIRQHHQKITDQLRHRWAKQAAEGLELLHSAGVIHCDISPRNFLLDLDLNLKISDFGGASLSGSNPSAVAGTRFQHPGWDWDAPPVFGDDIFSLGSLIYFIMTGSYPYEDRHSDEVEKLYMDQNFPDVTTLTCGSIIYRCWNRDVATAQQVYDYLESLEENNES